MVTLISRNPPAALGQIPATAERSYDARRLTWYNAIVALAAAGGATAAFGSLKKGNSLVSNIGLGALGLGLAGLGAITLLYNSSHMDWMKRNPTDEYHTSNWRDVVL